jgi:hypothetical protein
VLGVGAGTTVPYYDPTLNHIAWAPGSFPAGIVFPCASLPLLMSGTEGGYNKAELKLRMVKGTNSDVVTIGVTDPFRYTAYPISTTPGAVTVVTTTDTVPFAEATVSGGTFKIAPAVGGLAAVQLDRVLFDCDANPTDWVYIRAAWLELAIFTG